MGKTFYFLTVALFSENDDSVNQLAYNVSAKIVNILDTVLPKNKIVPRSEYIENDVYNVTRVGEEIDKQRKLQLLANIYSVDELIPEQWRHLWWREGMAGWTMTSLN